MASVTIHSDFGAQENKLCHCFHWFSICHEVMGPDVMIFTFWMLSFKPAFSFSSFTFIKGLFSCGVICIFEVIDISPSNLDSSLCFIQPAFHTMSSAYTLNEQGDNTQPWCTPFPIWNQSIVPCLVLTVASSPTKMFLRRQVRWSGIPISLRIFHGLLWATQSTSYQIFNGVPTLSSALSCLGKEAFPLPNLWTLVFFRILSYMYFIHALQFWWKSHLIQNYP